MKYLLANNAESTLAVAINAVATTVQVQAADAAKFPSPTAGSSEGFHVTLQRVTTGEVEVMRCTARSGVNLTVVRAQEGTAAITFSINDIVSLRASRDVLYNAINGCFRRLKGNLLINGAFQVWQRGTSFASGALQYTADRFQFGRAGSVAGATLSRQTGQSAQYALRMQRDAGNASTANTALTYNLETVDAIPAAGLPVTLKFKGQCGANFSPAGSTISVEAYTGTGTDQNINSGFTGQAALITQSPVVSITQATFEYTATVPAGTKQIAIAISFTPTGVAGAADWLEIEELQLVIGDDAGNFPYRTYQEELALCQRYLPACNSSGANNVIGTGVAVSATTAELFVPFHVPARIAPTGITVSAVGDFDLVQAATTTCTNLVFNRASVDGCNVFATVAAGLTNGFGYILKMNNTAKRILFTGCEL